MSRRVVSNRDEAVDYFKSIGEKYKAEIIESIPADRRNQALSRTAVSPICAAGRTCRPRASSRCSS